MIKNVLGGIAATYCIVWIIAILLAMNNAEFCKGPALTVLWVDGLRTVVSADFFPDSGECQP